MCRRTMQGPEPDVRDPAQHNVASSCILTALPLKGRLAVVHPPEFPTQVI